MANRNDKQKGSSWVTSAFDDFDLSSSPPQETNPRKRSRDSRTLTRLGKKPHQKSQQQGTVLWVEIYAPTAREDLAVHKKKVQEVESWLVESMAGMQGRRFLLLTGPAGCGKSATVKLLAKEARLNLLEWINPTTSSYDSNFPELENRWIPGDTVSWTSQTSQFWDFLIRTSKYNSVCGSGKQKNLVCFEDFPNAILRDPSSFHAMLRKYNKRVDSNPVVFIMTDSTHQQSSVKHLFPPDLQQDLSIVNIVFNPIASGLLVKALNRVVSLENTCEGTQGQPAPTRDALLTLAEASGGDVRSAINALQFASKKDIYQLGELFTGPSSKKKTLSRTKSSSKVQSSKSVSSSKLSGEDDPSGSVTAIGGKDATLFLFRALGKVLYCKRNHEVGVADPLPKHLLRQERSPLQENAESIYDKTSMGANSFSLFLHHNCLSFFSDIDSVGEAMQHFTDSDVLAAEWTGRDVLEDYAASVTIRGVMHANKGSTSSSSGSGWRPFTRPLWYKVYKDIQQNGLALKNEHRLASITSEELTTVVVPLKAKILSAQRKGHFSLTNEMGLFNSHTQAKKSSTIERLGEHDANVSIAEEDQEELLVADSTRPAAPLDTSVNTQEFATNNQQDDEDLEEDFRIDDFDD